MLKKFAAIRHQEWLKEMGEDDEEDNHQEKENCDNTSKSATETETKIEMDLQCRECERFITDERKDWWCEYCGYGLCGICRQGASLNHLCGQHSGDYSHRNGKRKKNQ